MLYLEVLMQLLYGSRRGENEGGTLHPNLVSLGLPLPSLYFPNLLHTLPCQHPRCGTGKRRRKGKVSPGQCILLQRELETLAQQLEIGQSRFPASPKSPSLGLSSRYSSCPALEEGAFTAYWNFSLYSRSLARALRSSSATEQGSGQKARTMSGHLNLCEGSTERRFSPQNTALVSLDSLL